MAKPILRQEQMTLSMFPGQAAKQLALLETRGWRPIADLGKFRTKIPGPPRASFYLLTRTVHAQNCKCDVCQELRLQKRKETVIERGCKAPTKAEPGRRVKCSDPTMQREFQRVYGNKAKESGGVAEIEKQAETTINDVVQILRKTDDALLKKFTTYLENVAKVGRKT